MSLSQNDWTRSKDALVREIVNLGFRPELGEVVARELKVPKAMDRMRAYLREVKPKTEELVVDEMLAICSEIDAWRKKKEAEAANASITELYDSGFGEE